MRKHLTLLWLEHRLRVSMRSAQLENRAFRQARANEVYWLSEAERVRKLIRDHG